MNTQDFLKGYFFSSYMLSKCNSPSIVDRFYTIEVNLMYLKIMTKNYGQLLFAINRGISPLGGRIAFCITHPQESLFDIVDTWVDKEVWNFINFKYIHEDEQDERDEIRLDINQLCEVIDFCGGIDLDMTAELQNK